jgi:hypothetical protein
MSGTLFNPMKSGLRKRLQGKFMHLLSELLANDPVSDVERKANCPPDISHLSRGQGRDQASDFPLRNSLQVVAVDCTIAGHSISL